IGGIAGGASVFQQLGQHLEDVSGDRGVLKEVIRAGSGQKPDANRLKYSGYLEHADKPFDTNCFHRCPKLMKIGEDVTLLGMEIGLLTMQKGELSRFIYSPEYAFGNMGCPPLIPPSATVLFEVELLDFLDTAESDWFCNLTPKQQSTFPLDKVLKIANTEKEFGNYLFKRNGFEYAKDRYKKASSLLSERSSLMEDCRPLDAVSLCVNLNLSLAYLKLQRPSRALIWGERALRIDGKNTKALFRCGQACLEMKEYKKAQDFLIAAQKLEPFNLEINSELKRLSSCYQDFKDQEKEMCRRMFATHSSTAALI
uniref:peptidylprolyl isomerase n=1 Tax=Leptobrachium leishanense TaxID=445787 RepID=A0A8C5LQF6_9ANUR